MLKAFIRRVLRRRHTREPTVKQTFAKPSILTAACAVVSAVGALALTACGPHDIADIAAASPALELQSIAVVPAAVRPANN